MNYKKDAKSIGYINMQLFRLTAVLHAGFSPGCQAKFHAPSQEPSS